VKATYVEYLGWVDGKPGQPPHPAPAKAATRYAEFTLTRTALDRVLLGQTTLLAEAEGSEIEVEPDVAPLAELLELLDEFKIWFNVIEP
jgi:alkyl sulfatase BDS1-like metallo-beta-lactamase superfamily hydrolase